MAWPAARIRNDAAPAESLETRAKAARLRHSASVEDVDYHSARGLDRALFLKLAACDWINERRNLLITGASGLGKSWLACALGQKPAGRTCPSSTTACRGCSPISRSRMAMDVTPGSYARSLAPNC